METARVLLKKKQKRQNRKILQKEDAETTVVDAEYWSKVKETDGFDIEHLEGQVQRPSNGLHVFRYDPDDYRSIVVGPYAKMGLHWYNLQEGTNFELHHIEKFNKSLSYMPCIYYITCVAEDPATRSRLTFQTVLKEMTRNTLRVICYLTRPKNEAAKPTSLHDRKATLFNHVHNPKWPSDVDPFNDHTGRFYVVGGQEMNEHTWIRLYLNLAFVTSNRSFYNNRNLFTLKLVKVAVETDDNVKPSSEKLKGPRNATFYIRFDQDLGDGHPVFERRCVIRRAVDLISGRVLLTLDSAIHESMPRSK